MARKNQKSLLRIRQMALTNKKFTQAANNWDLETLYADLKAAKGRPLTPVEKLHLCGLLCDYSPAEIAEILHKSVKGVEVELSNSIYQYVKTLLDKTDEKLENWRNIAEWLEEAGYKKYLSLQSQLNNCIPVDIVGKIANVSIGKGKITIEIDLRPTNQQFSELPEYDLNDNGNNNVES
jgi:hypothetical protein